MHDQRNRREVGDRIVAELRDRERGWSPGIAREKHGVAVGRGAGGGLGGDIAAGAAAVLDHHLLAPDVGEPGGEDAGDGVGSAARRKRHDQPHEAVGPSSVPAPASARAAAGRSSRELARAPTLRTAQQAAATDHVSRSSLIRIFVAASAHSRMLMPASLITGPHLSISALRNAASSAGVEPTTTRPSCSSRPWLRDRRGARPYRRASSR